MYKRSALSVILMADPKKLPLNYSTDGVGRIRLSPENKRKFQARYREVRDQLGWSTEQIAAVTGYSVQTIPTWTTVACVPPLGIINLFEAILADTVWKVEIWGALQIHAALSEGGKKTDWRQKRILVPGKELGPRGGGRRQLAVAKAIEMGDARVRAAIARQPVFMADGTVVLPEPKKRGRPRKAFDPK